METMEEANSDNQLDEGALSTVTFGFDADPLMITREQSIVSICTAGNRTGCAIYRESAIHLVGDRRDSGDPYKGLDIVIQRENPGVVIVSTAQRKLITFLEKIFTIQILDINMREKPSDEVHDPDFTLAIVPNRWFSMSQGEQKLIESEWVNNNGVTDAEQKPFFVFSRIKKSVDVCAIRAISAIDQFLINEHLMVTSTDTQLATNINISQTKHFRQTVESQISQHTISTHNHKPADNLMPILDVRYMDPGPVLSIDKTTLQTLGIFSFSRNKQDLNNTGEDTNNEQIPSLYDALNQCQSSQGRKMLHTMMMWPLQEMIEIDNRLRVVELFVRPENKVFRDQLVGQLKNVVPMSNILTKLSQSVGSYRDLSTVYKSLWSFLALIDIIKTNNLDEVEIFSRIVSLDSEPLRETVNSIVNIVDFESSKREKRVLVQTGVDQVVDEKKEIAKNLMKFCDGVAIRETAKYKDVLGKTCSVLYIPRIGFLTSVQFTSTSELVKLKMNSEFDILLHTEEAVYFKTKKMEELDIKVGDIACDLTDAQESVIGNLQEDILRHSETILRLMELFGELDCLISFAMVSSQRGYTRPEFVTSSDEVDIQEASHPLQSIRTQVVPNDIKFYKSDNRKAKVMVITGPNSCGKTSYMKTACLLVYMAHIGCFVPAISAKIPVVDAILTRMHSANSISTGLSSFATDLHQVGYALNRATEKSFIAIDEFGKGTLAKDGFNLLKSLVAYFARRGKDSPFVMVSTHFNGLGDHLQNYSEFILYKTFNVLRDPMRDTIVYEFKLRDGVSESSLADQVARKAGVPADIIARANQIRQSITSGRALQARHDGDEEGPPPLGA